MGQYIPYMVGSFVVSMVCGFVCIPAIIDFCVKRGLYDLPDGRKIHKTNIPRLGGICFLPSMFLAFLIAMIVFDNFSLDRHLEMSMWSFFFFVSLLLIYVVGFIDDMIGLGAGVKFAVQIVATTLMPIAGLYINNLYGLFGIYNIPFWVGAPLTVFVMVFIVNAMNLIDGIDGLCGSLALLALGGFMACYAGENVWTYCVLIAGLMGVLIAFLYFNVFGKPEKHRKIFMGDTGSLTLGFILAFLFVKFSMDNPYVKPFSRDSMLLAYTLLIVPVFDVTRVIIVRSHHHKPIFSADKNHLHHKLMRAGLSQHKALGFIVISAVLYIALNMMLYKFCSTCIDNVVGVIVVIDIMLWCLLQGLINKKIRQRGQQPYLALEEQNV